VAPERLSVAAVEAINDARRVGIPAISCFEVSRLAARGRMRLDRGSAAWIVQALGNPRVEVFDVNPEIAQAAGELDQKRFPGDPIDRLIYATAREVGADLVTADKRIREFDPQRTIW
jgi:PIN domain nuclease of toxin-antitoxin system